MGKIFEEKGVVLSSNAAMYPKGGGGFALIKVQQLNLAEKGHGGKYSEHTFYIRQDGKDMLGIQISIMELNQASWAVLNNSQRFFESTWTDGFIVREPKMEDGQAVLDKNGKPKTSLKIKFEKILDLRIGRYTADALLVISTSERDIPFQAETSFIVFPWLVVLGSVLFIIFAGVGLFSTFKKIVLRIIRIFRK